jgi:GrpB-like predicted nucleotidyltransferase (UPF0157 family)
MSSSGGEPLGMDVDRPGLVDHDARWVEIFDALRRELEAALGDRIVTVEHVGSTAIPGLRAKPVLDVLVVVDDLETSLACVPDLARLGFEFGPEDDIAERHYFRKWLGDLRTHHLSLAARDSDYVRDTLCFRDALRRSPALAEEYEALKERLYQGHRRGAPLHRGKDAFVARVLANARGPSVP